MKEFINPFDYANEVCHALEKGILLTTQANGKVNTMTIGWAQMGTLWAKPVCTVFVRPERYTYTFMESHDYFTVSFLPADLRKTLGFCGTKSGRDVDKIKECGLTVAYGAGEHDFASNLHSANERARISQLLLTAEIYAAVIVRICAEEE